MLKKNIIFIIMIVLNLTACANDNPRKGGFFGGLSGIANGTYESRVKERENELMDQQATNTKLKQESNMIGAETQVKESVLESEHHRVAMMEKELVRLGNNVDRTTATSVQQKKDLSTLQLKINELKRKMQSQQSAYVELNHDGGCETNAVRCQILEKERNRLAEEFEKLIDYYQALSESVN
jgi:predicted nuclease with TOPRIM domain